MQAATTWCSWSLVNAPIRRSRKSFPNLVILCTRIEELDGFQLLTMLKLDPDTRDIPVLTYTTEYEGQDFDDAISRSWRKTTKTCCRHDRRCA